MYSCDGDIEEYRALDDDSDFNRTFGVVDTCAEILEEVGLEPPP